MNVNDTEAQHESQEERVRVAAGAVTLDGLLYIPERAHGVVIISHGSVNSLENEQDRALAALLNESGLTALLLNPLTPDELTLDRETSFFDTNINLLGQRIVGAANWLQEHTSTRNLAIGCLGIGAGVGAAIFAAAERPDLFDAIVTGAGRLDFARDYLHMVQSPALVLVGEQQDQTGEINRASLQQLQGETKLETIGGSGDFMAGDSAALQQAARLACDWFNSHLRPIQ